MLLVDDQGSSASSFPPSSAASCRAARSRLAEGRPARPPPRASRRRSCRIAASVRRASASSDSTAASSSRSAGDSRAATPAMPCSGVACSFGASGVLLAGLPRGRAARAFEALGSGTAPNRSACPASAPGLWLTASLVRPSLAQRTMTGGKRLQPLPQLGPSASRAGIPDRHGERLALSDKHHQPLAPGHAGVEQVARQHGIVLRG